MTTSMARDFERGRRTELDALAGTLVRLADAKRVPVPVTRTCYAILKLREMLAEPRSEEVGMLTARG
jgi:ketopantoate reductase